MCFEPRFAAVVAITCVLTGCLPDRRMKLDPNQTPRQLDDGWTLSTPAAEGLDPSLLGEAYAHFFAEDEFPTAISMLVIRHGKLVAEGYCRDMADIHQLNALQSATKSVTSLLTGMAIAEGALSGVDQKLFELIPDSFDTDASRRDLTFRHLLTMRTGIDFSNDSFSKRLLIDEPPDSLKFILQRPMKAAPGTAFEYIDAAPHLVSGAIGRALGRSLEDYAAQRLFAPLGIKQWVWEHTPDGVTTGAVGLYLTPRDFARLGQLALNRGTWLGRPLVEASWMDEAARAHTDTPQTEALGFRYGYYWWTLDSDGAYAADGHGGQFLLIVPAKDLLIVFTAEPHTTNDVGSINLEDFAPLARQIVAATVD